MFDLFSAKFFEALNGTFSVAFACLLVIFGRFLFDLWHDQRHYAHRWTRFRREAAPAIAITVVLLGDDLIRGAVWIPRWMVNHHYGDASAYANQFLAVICLGALIGLWGAWCIARVYGGLSDAVVTVVLSLLVGLGAAWPWW